MTPPRRLAAVACACALLVAGQLGLPSTLPAHAETCTASYYDHGTTTASGEPFDPEALTAAHRTLPFGTMLRVTDTDNGNSVVVRINDRGPFAADRCLDLTRAAFQRLAPLSRGVLPVSLSVATPTPPTAAQLASRILARSRITLATGHLDPRGDDPPDGATAHENIADTARGLPARRSAYGSGAGGSVALSAAMLRGMLDLASQFTFGVAEIAGGSHTAHSRNGRGLAFDVDSVDGQRVLGLGGDESRFMDACRAAGATETRYQGLSIVCGW